MLASPDVEALLASVDVEALLALCQAHVSDPAAWEVDQAMLEALCQPSPEQEAWVAELMRQADENQAWLEAMLEGKPV